MRAVEPVFPVMLALSGEIMSGTQVKAMITKKTKPPM
jgi:hypothetical protein